MYLILDSSYASCYIPKRMKSDITDLDVKERLEKWAEITALSIRLVEASLQKEFPGLSSEELHIKVIERLHVFRRVRLSEA